MAETLKVGDRIKYCDAWALGDPVRTKCRGVVLDVVECLAGDAENYLKVQWDDFDMPTHGRAKIYRKVEQ